MTIDESHKVMFQTFAGGRQESTPAIFMILLGDRERVHQALGTGFFVTEFGLFFTAAHVIPEESQPCSLIDVIPEDHSFLQRSVSVAYSHRSTDIAVGLAESAAQYDTGERFSNSVMAVTSELPSPGEVVFSFGYPNTVFVPEGPIRPGVVMPMPLSVHGVVEEHYPTGRDRVLQPGHCIQVSFAADPGASGSPVMDSHGRVFGVVSTSLDAGPTFVAPLCDIFEAPFPHVRVRDDLHRVPRIRDLLPFSGDAPPRGHGTGNGD